MKRLSLKTKMVLLVLGALVPLSSVGMIHLVNDFRSCISDEKADSEAFARSTAALFDNYIEDLWLWESVLGNYFAASDMDADEIQRYITETGTTPDDLTSLLWISPDGTVLASQDPDLTGVSVSENGFFSNTLRGDGKVVTDIVPWIKDSTPVIIVARRIENSDGLYGILAGQIDPRNFSEKLMGIFGMSEREFSIIDKKGNTFYKNEVAESPAYLLAVSVPYLMEPESTGTVEIEDGQIPAGHSAFSVVHPALITGWRLVVSFNSGEIANKYRILLYYGIMVLFVSVITVIPALKLGKRATEPLNAIRNTVTAVRNGNFAARTNVYGNSEMASLAQDIDKMIDSITENDRMKSRFFTDLSHELKTPLNVIFASAQLIESFRPSQQMCENHQKMLKQVRTIKQNCYRLIRIIGNLMDVTKFENGYLPLNMGNHNIIRIIEDITMSVVNYAENKDIKIIFDTDDEVRYMACDPDMIERIMLNLLSNALKFTDKGGVISVSVSNKVDRVIIQVSDTGIGIPPDKILYIFDRFKQVESTLEKNRYGTGIGLSLVKSLVEAHNGSIFASSEPCKGSVFTIHLPVRLMSGSQPSAENEKVSGENRKSLVERINIEFSDIYDIN